MCDIIINIYLLKLKIVNLKLFQDYWLESSQEQNLFSLFVTM